MQFAAPGLWLHWSLSNPLAWSVWYLYFILSVCPFVCYAPSVPNFLSHNNVPIYQRYFLKIYIPDIFSWICLMGWMKLMVTSIWRACKSFFSNRSFCCFVFVGMEVCAHVWGCWLQSRRQVLRSPDWRAIDGTREGCRSRKGEKCVAVCAPSSWTAICLHPFNRTFISRKSLQIRRVGVSNESAYGVMEFCRIASSNPALPRIVTIQVWKSTP